MPKLLIISPTPHYKGGYQIQGHGATVKELSFLGNFFDITHIAPLYPVTPPKSARPYSCSIDFIPLKPGGGNGLKKITLFGTIPQWIREIDKILKKENFNLIHIRTPSSLSLTALLYFIVHKNNNTLKWIKFAGNWEPNPTESLATKIQKFLLKKGVPHSFVTVNYFKNLPPNFIPFPNPSIYYKEYKQNLILSKNKKLSQPILLSFVGSLIEEKGIMNALHVVRRLKEIRLRFKFLVAGTGEAENKAKAFVKAHKLQDNVEFLGPIPHEMVFKIFKSSHFLLFPTYFNEGWPKVISEAMSMGTVPLAGRVSIIPDILEKYQIGYSIKADNIDKYVETIQYFLNYPAKWDEYSQNAKTYAVYFTYEYYGLKLLQILSKYRIINLPEYGNVFEEIKELTRKREFPL